MCGDHCGDQRAAVPITERKRVGSGRLGPKPTLDSGHQFGSSLAKVLRDALNSIEFCKRSHVIGPVNRLDTVNELDLSILRHLVFAGPIDQEDRLA
jgi:hypothetical protein